MKTSIFVNSVQEMKNEMAESNCSFTFFMKLETYFQTAQEILENFIEVKSTIKAKTRVSSAFIRLSEEINLGEKYVEVTIQSRYAIKTLKQQLIVR